ncbi:hypothetical protein OROHE_017270 [Orobanche hederae]
MDNGKRDWWNSPKWSDDYENGVDGYLDRTFATEAQGDQICCPCSKCLYRYWYHRNEVRDHIICKGFVPRLEKHMESGTNIETPANDNDKQFQFCDDMNGLLHDTFRAGANEETRKFYKLIEEGQEELYPGCKTFSKLAFTIRLFLFKCDHKLSNVAFSALLELLRSLIPDAKLPSSFREASNDLKMLGLDYIKIDACPNNCMLYWENHIEDTSCHVCNTSRWKSESRTAKKKSRKIPAKVLRYFPLKKRLQRIYMCSETARYMTWHEHERKKDGILRHPADGIDWQDFNKSFPSFAQEPRNVRLGLATDGFNPFNNVKILHSTWPVLLINYNLPPSMYMKSDFIMLSLIIPGPESPKNAIDVYMQPLVKELKELWESGIDTYDASSNQMFNMRAALHSTISDFPGYAMLSGWSTKGKTACPCCHYETQSTWLKFSKKTCYRDYRIFLEHDHPWRFNTKKFNGKKEERSAPVRLMGTEISELLSDFKNNFGAKQPKKNKDENPWRKKSCFNELPYWKNVKCRHNLDTMHIEKNLFDNILGTLLTLPKKNKDHEEARKDLVELGIMPELQPQESVDGIRIIPKARFWMSLEEKRTFCQVLKNAKIPQDCGANIKRYVQVKERKIAGYKSHDAHFMMHHLLPMAVSTTLQKDVVIPLIRLSAFFKAIWSKEIDPEDLDRLQTEIVEVLCELEQIFPPAFFDIMVHLPIHLVEEIRLGGPVASRSMYPVERYLRKLKLYVRNKAQPEASMAEGYLIEECLRLCARYLNQGVKNGTEEVVDQCASQFIFNKTGHPLRGRGRTKQKNCEGYKIDHKTWMQVQRYILSKCHAVEIESYINMGKRAILESDKAPKITKYEEERLKRLAFNRERMQAAGFTTCLANKAILNNTINLQQKNVEQDSSWSDHELEPNKQHECDEDSILIPKGSHCVKSN